MSKANTKANTKALSKAIQKHSQKHSNSIAHIDKQLKPNNNLNKKEFDFSFVENEFKEVFFEWLEYKKERKESYKSQKSLKAAYENMKEVSNNDPEIAKKCVKKSMSSNWAGLFELKDNKGKQNNQTTSNVNDIWQK